MSTKIGVFIIESRKIEEEKKGKRQGLILTEMLTLLGINFEYRYIRTKKELIEMVNQYYASKFRYLHLSMHGVSGDGKPINKFSLTLEKITYDDFCNIIIKNGDDRRENRRLFISACHVVNDITIPFGKNSNSFMSIVAPSKTIKTKIAPLAWATFYNKMFSIEKNSMATKIIKENLQNICIFFNVKFKGYFRNKNSSRQYKAFSFPEQKE